MQAILTELCVSFDSSDILSTLNGLSKYGKLRFFIRTDEATKDRAPEGVRILKQIFETGILVRLDGQGAGARRISSRRAITGLA